MDNQSMTWECVPAYVSAMMRYDRARERARAILILVNNSHPTDEQIDDLAQELIEGGKA